MNSPITKTQRQALAKELSSLGHLIRGSLVVTGKKCGRKSCACAEGKLHPHTYLSISSGSSGRKKNRIVYVTAEQVAPMRAGIEAYQRAWEILNELTDLNIRQIKEG